MLCRFSQSTLVLSLVAASMLPAIVSAANHNTPAAFSKNANQHKGQTAVHYQFSFANAVHNEALVTVRFSQLPAGPLQLQFSNASPGRYARHDFAKNIYQLTARNSKGEPLPLQRGAFATAEVGAFPVAGARAGWQCRNQLPALWRPC